MQLHEKSEITVQELKKLRDFNKNIQIIDVEMILKDSMFQ